MAKKVKGNHPSKKQKQVVKLVRKSNQLVEGRYKFDIWETRVFTKMLTLIKRDDVDFKNYRIYIKDVIDEFGLEKDNRAYERIKRAGIKLNDRSVRIYRDTDEGKMQFDTKIVASVESFVNNSEGKYIDVSFHPRMKPYLLALKSKFTVYDSRNIMALPSTYTIRIYELLKQYEPIGNRKIELHDLKEMIGAVEETFDGETRFIKDHYPLYGNFRQKVLLKAQKDLKKHTDISFEFEPLKRGRKVVALHFYIYKNSPVGKAKNSTTIPTLIQQTKLEQAAVVINEPEGDTFMELYPKVKAWIGERAFRNLLDNYPESQVRQSVRYTLRRIENGDEIKNVAGHIVSMAKQTDLFDPIELVKEEKKRKKDAAQEAAQQKENLQNELKDLQQELYNQVTTAIEIFLKNNKEARDIALVKTRGKKMSRYDLSKTDDENFLTNDVFRMSVFSTVQDLYPEVTENVKSLFQPQIDALKKTLRGF
jgi:plasmid replication initiation protein